MKNWLFYAGLTALPLAASGTGSAGVSGEVKLAFSKAGIPVNHDGRTAYDFSLSAITGQKFTLESLRGNVVFLNFWATWCGQCRAEMPSMEALYRRLHGQGLEMLACNVMETPDAVQQFMQQNHFTFPVVLDTAGEASEKYGVHGIPATYILNREGNIVLSTVGSINWNMPDMAAAFEVLLKTGQDSA